jgi:hypothetical protein
MRKYGWLCVGAALLFASVAIVDSIDGTEKKGKGGGGFGGFGGGFGQNPLSLLNNADVKKELDLTDEQATKANDEVMAAIGKALSEKQFKRFKQISLQQKGNNAFKDKAVQKELKLTADQVKSIDTAIEDGNKALADLGFGGGAEKRAEVRKTTTDKIQGALTAQQKTAWTSMVGEEFKFQTFGTGGFGKGKKDAKKDTPKDK